MALARATDLDPPPEGLPRHNACIMDGNGRWAEAKGMSRVDGHAAGERAILEFLDAALECGIPWISLFAFSTENWLRPASEVAFLMEFNRRVIDRHAEHFNSLGIRVRYMGGDDHRIPRILWEQMRGIEKLTADNERITLTMAFNHGGRAELVEAVRRMISAGISSRGVSEQAISQSLPYPDMPDPDLVIRTAGEHRLSNFALWRCAYSELIFTKTLWPDFSRQDFLAALEEYCRRKRTFGSIGAGSQ